MIARSGGPKQRKAVLILLLLVAFSISAYWWLPPLWNFLSDRPRIEQFVHEMDPWGPVGLIAMQALQVVLLPIPGFFGLLGGFLFGFGPGLVYCTFGTVLGSMIAFALAKCFGRPLVSRLVKGKWLGQIDELARNRGFWFFLLYYWVPYLPKDAMCYVAGLTPIRNEVFFVAVVLGRFPGCVSATLVGAGVWQLELPLWAWISIGVVLFCAIGMAIGYRKRLAKWAKTILENAGHPQKAQEG